MGKNSIKTRKGKGRKRRSDHPYLRENPDFPLSPHAATNRWYKVIGQRRHYFGRLDAPDRALLLYRWEAPYLHQGLTPPPMPEEWSGDDADRPTNAHVTLRDLVNRWLTRQYERTKAGKLADSTFDSYQSIVGHMLGVLGKLAPVTGLRPADFTRLADRIKAKYGPTTASKHVTVCRMVFKWAYENEVIDTPPRFGDEFRIASKAEKRVARWVRGRQVYTADEVRRLIDAADVHLHAMILLGINGGYTQKEVAHLRLDEIDLEAGQIDHLRPKTKERRTVPLWKETIEAIQASIEHRPTPKVDEAEGLLFITRTGKPWVRESLVTVTDKKTGRERKRLSRTDAVNLQFRKLLRRLNIDLVDSAFGKLRATHRTVADGAGDVNAARRIVGHEAGEDDPNAGAVDEHYVRTIDPARLRKVSDHVRKWLYTRGSKKKKR